MALSDEDLVRRCLNGEDSAYGFLVDKYKGAVHALARKKLGNHHDAEDVVQEVFIKAYQNLPSLKAPNCFAGWLYVITANECHRIMKKRAREKEGLLSMQEEIFLQGESEYASQRVKQQLHDAVEALPEADKTVIHLHYFGGLNCEEIGRFLGTSKDAVKMRLLRARNQLKKEMKEMLEQEVSVLQFPMQFTMRIMERVQRTPFIPPKIIRTNPFGRFIPIGSLLLSVLVIGFGLLFQRTAIPPTSWEGTREIDVPIDLLDWPIFAELLTIGGAGQESGTSQNQSKGTSKLPASQNTSSAAGLSTLAAEDQERFAASGIVLADGKPVANARIVACDYRTKVAETTSDANGRFVFELPPLRKGRHYALVAHSPGYAIGWYSQSLLKKNLQGIKIHLGEPTEHRGAVKDVQGNSIERAQVQVVLLSKRDDSVFLSEEIGYGFAYTDSDGNFSIPNLPKDSGVYLSIDHPDYALQVQRTIPVDKQMTFHLTKGGSIKGRVYFKETGESPKPLTVLACANVRFHRGMPPPRQEVKTDGEGNFIFSHIQPGNYYLLLPERAPGWTYVAPSVKVEEGKEISGADFALTKGAIIHGSVLCKDEPMAGGVAVRVFDSSAPLYGEATEPITVKTDENGDYQVQTAPGEVRLDVIAPKGYKNSQDIPKTLIVKEGEKVGEVNFELIESPIVTVRGKVQTANGTPVINATVLATPINVTTKTDENGEFVFEEIKNGTVLWLVASLPETGLKGNMPILAIPDTQVTITLAPADDKSAQAAVLAQDIREAAQKYRNLVLRRKRWSKGGREEDEPTGQEEGKQYRQGYFQLQELLTDYYHLAYDESAYLPDGWIYELTEGIVKFRFEPGPKGGHDIFGIGPSNDLLLRE